MPDDKAPEEEIEGEEDAGEFENPDRYRSWENLSKNLVENDLYDRNHFQGIREEAPNIKKVEEECKKKSPLIENLSQDVYSALFKAEPKEIAEKRIHPMATNHKQAIKALFESPDYEKLRNFTFLDEFASAIAAPQLLKIIAEHLPEPKKKEEEKKDGKGQGQGQGQGKGKQKGKGPGKQGLTPEQMEALKKAMESACKQATKDIDETMTCLSGWGTDPGEVQKLSFKEKFQMRDRFMKSDKLRKLARMVGRACNMALSAQKTKVKHGSDEVFDIEIGSDLARILPCEKMLLHTKGAARRLFFKKYAEGQLMQYKLRSTIKEQKGPIICCIDNSGSMSGDPELWSKALALGLLEIAVKQRRKLVILHFGARGERIARFDFAQGDAPLDRKIKMAEYFLGGGTDFEYPLDHAVDIVEKEHPKADVILVTDGECDCSTPWMKKWRDWRKKKGVNCYSVYIGENSMPKILTDISDHTVQAKDLYRAGDQYQREVYELL